MVDERQAEYPIAPAMNDPVSGSHGRRHNLADWLALHELDPATCRGLLSDMTDKSLGGAVMLEGTRSRIPPLDLEAAWLMTIEALRDFLPAQRSIIGDTFENTAMIDVSRQSDSRKALTLDNGPAAYPTILFSYRGEPSDCLIMAHEFGHALQIRACRGTFMPPVMREVCAFLAESALLSSAAMRAPAMHVQLVEAWQQDTHKYFGVQRSRLAAALSKPATPYRYAWNYPIARHLAIEMAERLTRDRIWSVFSGQVSVRSALQELASPPSRNRRDG